MRYIVIKFVSDGLKDNQTSGGWKRNIGENSKVTKCLEGEEQREE